MQEKTNKQLIVKEMFFRLLPAQLMSGLVSALSGVIVSVVVGNCLDAVSLASVGITASMLGALTAIIEVFSTGSRIQAGKAIGRVDMKAVNRIFSSCITAILVVASFLTLISIIMPAKIAFLIGARGEIIATTSAYIRGIAVGIIPMMLIPTMIVFASMMGEIKQAIITALILSGTVLVFSLLNGKVIMGGIFGMGLATSASEIIAFIYLLRLFHKLDKMPRYTLSKFNFPDVRALVILGTPSAMIYLLNAIRNVIINTAAVSAGGSALVAGLAIRATAYSIIYCYEGAITTTAIMMASTMIGEGDTYALRALTKFSMKIGFTGCIIINVLSSALAVPLCKAFGAEDMALEYAVISLRWTLISFIPDLFLTLVPGIHQCFGRIGVANAVYFGVMIGAPLIAAFILVPQIGALGIYMNFAIGETIGWIIVLGYSFIRVKHFPRSIDDLLVLRGKMQLENLFSYTVTTIEEVVHLAENLQSYCKSMGIESVKSFLAALYMEEMVANIINHESWSSKAKSKCIVDLLVLKTNDKIMLRLRDNCTEFNPIERLGNLDESDIFKNYGIKTVCSVAEEVKYQNALGMNVTSVLL